MPQPFGDPLGERSRELYGKYRKRYSSQKTAGFAYRISTKANGVNWVDLEPTSPVGILEPSIYNIALYRINMTAMWFNGTPKYRILVNDVKVYPFVAEEDVQSGVTVNLGTLSTAVRTGDHCKVQFRSDDPTDNPGDSGAELMMYLYLAELISE